MWNILSFIRLYTEVVTVDCIKVWNNLGSVFWNLLLVEEIYSEDYYKNRNSLTMFQFKAHTCQVLEMYIN